jgi:hypothetical protein
VGRLNKRTTNIKLVVFATAALPMLKHVRLIVSNQANAYSTAKMDLTLTTRMGGDQIAAIRLKPLSFRSSRITDVKKN